MNRHLRHTIIATTLAVGVASGTTAVVVASSPPAQAQTISDCHQTFWPAYGYSCWVDNSWWDQYILGYGPSHWQWFPGDGNSAWAG